MKNKPESEVLKLDGGMVSTFEFGGQGGIAGIALGVMSGVSRGSAAGGVINFG